MNRLVAFSMLGLLSGCVAPMASMQPVKRDGLDVVYQNGVPVTLSRAPKSSVIVTPVTTETGRYRIGPRLAFLVFVRNESADRIEIAEDCFSLTANDVRARTVTAIEMEDAIHRDAAWAQAANGFSAVLSSMAAAASAGHSTATVTSNGTTSRVTVYNQGEAQRAQREITRDHAETSAAIATRAQHAASNLSRVLQRNTLIPGAEVGGFVVMDVPRDSACVRLDTIPTEVDGKPGEPIIQKVSIPCHLTLTANVADETHSFVFDEAFSGR